MNAGADIYFEHEPWRGSLLFSVIAHAALFGGALVWAFFFPVGTGESWGGTEASGGAMSATLVGSTIPLPARQIQSESVVASESKGLSESLPKPEVREPEAIPIPDVDSRVKPQGTTPSRRQQERRPEVRAAQPNQVPFGQGAPASGPYSTFSASGATGGISMGAGGEFGSRYGWYVNQVRNKVAENWMQYEVDPNIRSAQRVYIQFEITRTGQPRGVQVVQSSGVPSLDTSAMRALQRIDTFGPLPSDYRGSSVMVEFWFDYKR
jgi:periplasmic protein TonB